MDTIRFEQAQTTSEILGVSHHARDMREFALMAAETESTVVLTGETGAGKDRLAERIHVLSELPGRFVPVVCGAIPKELMEAELFGHERGAFTGAHDLRIGLFEQADNGTIFLNEVDSMPLNLQVALLRFTEGRSFRRLGSSSEIEVKVRLIVGTNAEPDEMLEKGEFRHDLWHRLNVIPYRVPSLRERPEDILVLAKHFLNRRGSEKKLLPETESALIAYRWPGNIRELDNIIQRGIFFSGKSTEIRPQDLKLPKEVEDVGVGVPPRLEREGVLSHNVIAELLRADHFPTIEEWRHAYIPILLQKAGGNVSRATRIADTSRSNLYKYIKELDLEHMTQRHRGPRK